MKIDPEGYETELLMLLLIIHYLTGLSDYPCRLANLLGSSAKSLPPSLRCHLTKALILLTLGLFMELQALGDSTHVIHSAPQKHMNETQNALLTILQEEDEEKAKRALIIVNAAWKFFLGFEKTKEAADYSDADSSEDEKNPQPRLFFRGRMSIRVCAIRSMKRQQRANSEKDTPNYYSPLNHLIDAQGFAEKLFSRLQTCNEWFEVRMMILKVIERTVGLHPLILLNFYPFLQKCVQPHQPDITDLLVSAVQACHDMVPPDAVEPLFRQVVNQFVHDKSRPEEITVGLDAVREICLHIPLLMRKCLLQDLVLYRNSHEKAISTAVCPSWMVKKDHDRPTTLKTQPKTFGEVNFASNLSVLSYYQNDDGEDDSCEDKEMMMVIQIQVDVGVDDDNGSDQFEEEESDGAEGHGNGNEDEEQENSNKCKRKLSDYAWELNAYKSHRALKRIAKSTREIESSDLTDAKHALHQHRLSRRGGEAKAPALRFPTEIRRKMTKEERLELVKAGREDRGKFKARTLQRELRLHDLYKRERERLNRIAGKQFRGKKAWNYSCIIYEFT
ncbi:hypothetical protein MKW98_020416 [Papaver atlanticum]|uniref:Protein SDA1 n=1 Tax=Papaver atlanticum TaxID=357466 RepID=A0AAD4RW28_9MAGN|nr:hypothetical protein MKW98_020416 [Papaver atlanticum]